MLELNGFLALPSALRADIGGPLANDDHAIPSVGRIIPREQPGFAGKLVDRTPHVARFDNLTMLHSRMAMREKLGNSAHAAEAIGESAALVLLDLDDFDAVNDTYGQAVGDACLQGVGNRLIAAVGAVAFLARMGGDEFAVLLQGHTRRSLSHILKRIQEALAVPFNFHGHTLDLTSSIGIAVRCDGRRFNPDELIRDAALALNEAKASGKSCHRLFRRFLAQPAMTKSKLYGVCEARSPPASLNYTTSQRSRYAIELTAASRRCSDGTRRTGRFYLRVLSWRHLMIRHCRWKSETM